MYYFNDGYCRNEQAAERIERFETEGWRIVAVIPYRVDRAGDIWVSVLARHPSKKVPSWEE
jgi:hypothetical protein